MAGTPERLAVAVPAQDPPWRQALPVAARLREAGFQAWCVGGCVRDLLLRRAVHDIDLATDATPEAIEGLFPKTIAVGKSFGVMVVVADGAHQVEVATFRHDGRYLDGRRPEQVRFGTAAEDVARRDFTVNALLLDPIAGMVEDHVGGLADLRARVVRCVGDAGARLAEDRLRVLRALRFAATLGFAVEDSTWAAARACAISGLSRERVMEEWRKALAGAPGAYLRLCHAAERLSELTPPLHGFSGAEIAAAASALDRLAAAALPPEVREDAALAAWLAPASPDTASAWLATQPLERALVKRIAWLLQAHAQAGEFPGLSVPGAPADRARAGRGGARGARTRGAPGGACDHRADAPGRGAEQAVGPLPILVTGDDLLALGIPAGKRIGELLRRCEDDQLAGALATRDQALAAARGWASER